MLEVLEYLKEQVAEHGERYIIDKYKLQGASLYIKVSKQKAIEAFLYTGDETAKNENTLIRYFREKEFYSRTAFDSSNKCIGKGNKGVTPFAIDLARASTIDPQKREGYLNDTVNGLISFYMSLDDKVDYEQYGEFFKSVLSMSDISELIAKYPKCSRVKIFIDEDTSEYKRFYEYYLSLKAFSTAGENKQVGAHGFSVGYSADKPSLIMPNHIFRDSKIAKKFGLRVEEPISVSLEDAILIVKMNWVFECVAKEAGIYVEVDVDPKGKFLIDYEVCGQEPKTKEYEEVTLNKNTRESTIISVTKNKTRQEVIPLLDNFITPIESHKSIFFFRNVSLNNIEEEVAKVKDIYDNFRVSQILYSNKQRIIGYFKKNYSYDMFPFISKLTWEVVSDNFKIAPGFLNHLVRTEPSLALKKEKIMKAELEIRKKLDKRLSLLIYFEEKGEVIEMVETMTKVKTGIAEKIKNREEIVVENDCTYYVLVGQLYRYLVENTQTRNPSMRLLNKLLERNNRNKYKEILHDTLIKYSYAMPLNSRATFERIYEAVAIYQPKDNSLYITDWVAHGLMGTNVMYTKINKETCNEEEKGEQEYEG